MRLCNKNKRNLWYSYFRGENEVEDGDGLFTGEFEKNYTNPFKTKVNYNVVSNKNIYLEFGNIVGADLTIVTDKPIFTLETVVWTYEPDNSKIDDTYEYKVFKIVPSLNGQYVVGLKSRG